MTTIVSIVLGALLLLTTRISNQLKKKLKAAHLEKIEAEQKIAALKEDNKMKDNFIKRYDDLLGESIPLDVYGGRRNGKTTRLVTYYVDLLFRDPKHTVTIKEHHDLESRSYLISRIRNRLKYEHDVLLKIKDGNTLILDPRISRQSEAVIKNLTNKIEQHEQSARKHSSKNEAPDSGNNNAGASKGNS